VADSWYVCIRITPSPLTEKFEREWVERPSRGQPNPTRAKRAAIGNCSAVSLRFRHSVKVSWLPIKCAPCLVTGQGARRQNPSGLGSGGVAAWQQHGRPHQLRFQIESLVRAVASQPPLETPADRLHFRTAEHLTIDHVQPAPVATPVRGDHGYNSREVRSGLSSSPCSCPEVGHPLMQTNCVFTECSWVRNLM
jgi:hypothetical protein